MKKCTKCQTEKDLTEFSISSRYKESVYYHTYCKACKREYMRSDKARETRLRYNKTERGKTIRKAYKQRDDYKLKQRSYENIRLKTDCNYKLKKSLRDRLSKALKVKKWIKKTHFRQYIGCSKEELHNHIEKQFTLGMTWNNYGFGDNKWTIDHIIPLSSAKTEEEMYKLCHYSNLQPLWYLDNIKKSNK